MILDGVCFSAFIQFCRVILSRMQEPYCVQSSLDEYCIHCRVLSFLGVYRHPCVSPINVPLLECFNDWGGGDTTIASPGRSPKQPLPGIVLHDPLHSRQACPEFNSCHQGVGQISPRHGLFLCRPLPKRGQICDIPAPPPPIAERLVSTIRSTSYFQDC